MMRFAAALSCAVLAACGSLDAGRHIPPPGTPTARLHVEYVASTNDRAQIQVLKRPLDAKCGIGIGDIEIVTTLGGNPSSSYQPELKRDVLLAAGRPLLLHIFTDRYGMASVTTCGFRMRFQPEPDAAYEMAFTTLPGRCRLSLGRRVATADGAGRLEPIEIIDPHPECKR
jgi:hypothetical protein